MNLVFELKPTWLLSIFKTTLSCLFSGHVSLCSAFKNGRMQHSTIFKVWGNEKCMRKLLDWFLQLLTLNQVELKLPCHQQGSQAENCRSNILSFGEAGVLVLRLRSGWLPESHSVLCKWLQKMRGTSRDTGEELH